MKSDNQAAPAASARPAISSTGLLHLLVVYIVWGSTYLAIRVGVRPGSGFTPFMLGTMRALVAGSLLLGWGALTRQRLRLTRAEFWTLTVTGLLLWVGGNGLVMLGEQRADSGITALVIAGVPIWVAVMEAVRDRRLPSLLLVGSLLLGLGGIAVLSMPLLLSGVRADTIAVIELLSASVSWALGTFIQSRRKFTLSPAVSSGVQILAGGVGFLIVTLLVGEPLPHPVASAWIAWGYLVVFGSLLAFTSFVQALRLLPTRLVTTYSYVNPVIAVFLGFIILNEKITPWTIAGAVLVLLGVAGVFRSHSRS
jgi:drug/metabolite transporter (DMT)-like permease